MASAAINGDSVGFRDVEANVVVGCSANQCCWCISKPQIKTTLIAIGINGAAGCELNNARAGNALEGVELRSC